MANVNIQQSYVGDLYIYIYKPQGVDILFCIILKILKILHDKYAKSARRHADQVPQ